MTESNPAWLPEEIRDVAERWGLPSGSDLFGFVLDAVTEKVRHWLETDRRMLMQTLYRLDVSEAKVRPFLGGSGDTAARARKIAELVLQRELQKARTRRAAQ